MVKCPRCENEINQLVQDELVWAEYHCWLSDDKESLVFGKYGSGITESADDKSLNVHFRCPNCGVGITNSPDKAVAFLRG